MVTSKEKKDKHIAPFAKSSDLRDLDHPVRGLKDLIYRTEGGIKRLYFKSGFRWEANLPVVNGQMPPDGSVCLPV